MPAASFDQLSAAEKRHYNCPRSEIAMIESFKAEDTFKGHMLAHDSSFGEWRSVRRIERNGRHYERMSRAFEQWMLDIEVKPDGYIGELVPVPPEEAFQEELAGR